MENNFSKELSLAFETNKIKQYKEGELQILEELGKGAFGAVSKALIIAENETVAVKFLDQIDDKSKDYQETIKTILNELKAMTRVEHPKIPKFYGVYQRFLNNANSIGLIFSFIDGVTLDKYIIKNCKTLSKLEKCKIAIQLVEIIHLLHQNRVTHRDIKPGNVMIKHDGDLVLLDFGISKVSETTMAFTNGVRCSPKYSPPEAFEENGEEDTEYTITPKFDVWSMGCVILEIFTGVAPWGQKFTDGNKIMMAMMRGIKYNELDFPYPKEFDKNLPEIFEVCKRCQIKDITKRYSSKELLVKLNELKDFYEKEEKK